MGCGKSRATGERRMDDVRDAPAVPPIALPPMAPLDELESLLAEAVRLGLLDRRAGAETRRRVVAGELELAQARRQWREILGFDEMADAEEIEVELRLRAPPPPFGRVRSGSLVANAHDDMLLPDEASDGGASDDGESEERGGGAVTPPPPGSLRRLSFLRTWNTAGALKWDSSTGPAPAAGNWVPFVVLSCGKFGLGVFRTDDPSKPLSGAPRLQVGDTCLGRVPEDDDDPMVTVRLDAGEGVVMRFREERAGRRAMMAVAAYSPERPRRSPGVPLGAKLDILRAACASLAVPWERGHVDLVLRREFAAEDAVSQTSALRASQFRQIWKFDFASEPGMDAGGVARECWALVAAGVYDPTSPYWRFAATDNVTLQIRPRRSCGRADRLHYRNAGRLAAKALFDGVTIPAFFNRPLLKHILARPVVFDDLESVDATLYRSCRYVLDNGGVDALCLTFSYRDRDGADAVDLGEGGRDVDVDDANKEDYVARLFKCAMLDAIAAPLSSFLKGFYDVVPLAALNAAALDPGDLELAICGLDSVDVDDWRSHAAYSGGYGADAPTVVAFWAYVAALSDERRAKLLQFVTGTSRVPAGGFANLQGRDGVTKCFELRLRPGERTAYPLAHTCFNRLDLPDYADAGHLAAVFDALLDGDILGFSGD